MGLSDESRAYRYYKPDTKNVLMSQNVVFSKEDSKEDIKIPPHTQLSEGESLGSTQPIGMEKAGAPAGESKNQKLTIIIQ